MREISLPENDHYMASIVRDAIARREPITITQQGRPVLDLVPRTHSSARFSHTSREEREAAIRRINAIRETVRDKLSIEEIIALKHEGHHH